VRAVSTVYTPVELTAIRWAQERGEKVGNLHILLTKTYSGCEIISTRVLRSGETAWPVGTLFTVKSFSNAGFNGQVVTVAAADGTSVYNCSQDAFRW
jgi:hypothetical protein